MALRSTWDYFFTITLKPAHHNDSWNQQREYFDKFIDSIQHHKIVAVIELQKNGSMHIHGIISFYYEEGQQVDFRKYFYKMKNKIKPLGKSELEVVDDYMRCMSYCFKDVHNGYVNNPVIIDDYNKLA